MRGLIAAAMLVLAGCETAPTDIPPAAIVVETRIARIADGVTVQIGIDPAQEPVAADAVAAAFARLLGPAERIGATAPGDALLVMTGRLDRRTLPDGRAGFAMDWDVREAGGAPVTLFRVAIVAQDPGTDPMSQRDADGLAWFTADRLSRDAAVREIVRARRR